MKKIIKIGIDCEVDIENWERAEDWSDETGEDPFAEARAVAEVAIAARWPAPEKKERNRCHKKKPPPS